VTAITILNTRCVSVSFAIVISKFRIGHRVMQAREEHIAISDNEDETNGKQNNARSKATKRTWPLNEVEDKLSNKLS